MDLERDTTPVVPRRLRSPFLAARRRGRASLAEDGEGRGTVLPSLPHFREAR